MRRRPCCPAVLRGDRGWGTEGVSTVRALVYHGPAQSSWDTVQDPAIEEATDAIVRVDATAVRGVICTSCEETFPR